MIKTSLTVSGANEDENESESERDDKRQSKELARLFDICSRSTSTFASSSGSVGYLGAVSANKHGECQMDELLVQRLLKQHIHPPKTCIMSPPGFILSLLFLSRI